MVARDVRADWIDVVARLEAQGWARVEDAVAPRFAGELERAAPGPWTSLPATEGGAGVRQAGSVCHAEVVPDSLAVAALAEAIRLGIDGVTREVVPSLPAFNHAEWCRAERGEKFITPHRDPSTAGGVIAVLTIRGQAPFRVWDMDGNLADAERQPELAETWETQDRDLVLLTGGGWPTSTSRCPIHEAQPPRTSERLTLTLRHNKGGYGADYFA